LFPKIWGSSNSLSGMAPMLLPLLVLPASRSCRGE